MLEKKSERVITFTRNDGSKEVNSTSRLYPFSLMREGDWFEVHFDKCTAGNLVNLASSSGKELGVRFKCRTVIHWGEKFCRVEMVGSREFQEGTKNDPNSNKKPWVMVHAIKGSKIEQKPVKELCIRNLKRQLKVGECMSFSRKGHDFVALAREVRESDGALKMIRHYGIAYVTRVE